jgi:y4mF family transcriptional regulator
MRNSSLIPDDLVAQIKTARLKARLSQDDLADLAGISRRPIYLLESGKGAIRLDNLIKILDALGLVLEIHPKRGKS